MVQVRPGMVRAGGATALRIKRSRIIPMAGIFEVDRAESRECLTGPPGAAGKHAVEHVHPPLDGSDNVVGFSDAHQVSRAVLRQHFRCVVEHREHPFLPLPDRQPADCVAVEPQRPQHDRTSLAQLPENRSLLNSEQRATAPPAERIPAAFGPTHRKKHGILCLALLHRIRCAFIEAHDDVRAELSLDFHRSLRGQIMH